MRALLFALFLPVAASAGPDDSPGRVSVVQNRLYRMKHELTLGGGVLPLDAFYKGVVGKVGYTFHFNDHFGWQVGRMTLSRSIYTNLRRQLERDFGVLTTDFDEVQWLMGSDLIWSPLYGKTTFMNLTLLYLQLFVTAGGSGLSIKTGPNTSVQPAFTLGGGLRFFATERFSVRVDVSNHFVMGKKKFNVLDLQAGLAINLGSLD